MKKIAIIIPTFNELDNIENLVKEILKNVPESKIFIVDDSNDKKIGDLLNLKNLNATYLHRENSKGRGSAVLHGLRNALKEDNFDIFIEMDADFSHDPTELRRNIEYFYNNNLDLLIASRYQKKSKIINWGINRRILSKLSNILARILLGVKLKDFTNGFRIYSKKATEIIEEVVENPKPDTAKERRERKKLKSQKKVEKPSNKLFSFQFPVSICPSIKVNVPFPWNL